MREGSFRLWELLKKTLGSERTVTKKEISCQMTDLHLQNAVTLHLVPPLSHRLIQKCALGTEQLS